MARLILDSGAIIALAARDATVRRFVERAVLQGTLVVAPAVMVAETTCGGPRDATVNRVLTAVDEITPVTETTARLAGRLLAASDLSNATIDALVVAEAVLGGSAILLTSDVGDISALAAGHPHVHVHGV